MMGEKHMKWMIGIVCLMFGVITVTSDASEFRAFRPILTPASAPKTGGGGGAATRHQAGFTNPGGQGGGKSYCSVERE